MSGLAILVLCAVVICLSMEFDQDDDPEEGSS